MNNLETIEVNGSTYAYFFQKDIEIPNAAQFITQAEDPMQVGIFEREKGYQVPAHRHISRTVELQSVGEFLLIQSGSAVVEVFNDAWEVLCTKTVTAGDCVIFLRGGHAVKTLEPTRILEVKQGPYLSTEKEKTFRPTV